MALTDVAIRKAKPTDSPVRMFDGGGLYIEIVPSGGKWWRLKYRYAGKEKRLSLGTFPDTGLKAVRDARDSARKQLAAGVDPSADRKAEKEIARVAALSTLERAARAWLAHRSKAWKPGTLAMITASLENDVFPALGSRPLGDIQPRDIATRSRPSRLAEPGRLLGGCFSGYAQSSGTQSRTTSSRWTPPTHSSHPRYSSRARRATAHHSANVMCRCSCASLTATRASRRLDGRLCCSCSPP